MNQEILALHNAVTAIQIKLAALESLLLSNDELKAKYETLIDSETKRFLAVLIPIGQVC